MKKYYRFFRLKYNYWFENAIPVWVLPILIPVGIVAALASVLVAALFFIGAIIVVPIDYTLDLFNNFNKDLVLVIEEIFMRGEK